MSTLYELLDVAQQSSLDDIRRAYHRAARRYHPDKQAPPSRYLQSTAEASAATATITDEPITSTTEHAFVRIQEAYETLRDPQRRAQYDAQLLRDAVVRKRDVELVRVADVVSVRDMTREVLAADNTDDCDDVLLSHPCRCGDVYEVTEDELLDGVDVVPCNGCSLNIRVLLS